MIKYGRLTLVGRTNRSLRGRVVYRFLCECGEIFYCDISSVRGGNTSSCGCLRREMGGSEKIHGFHGTPTYISWVSMKQRCLDRNTRSFSQYGAKGIVVCDEWRNSFQAFLRDMGPRPEGTSIDRIDNSRGYFPENCRWATRETQMSNRASADRFVYGGQKKTMSDWARHFGVHRHDIKNRIRRGMTFVQAIQDLGLIEERIEKTKVM